VLTVNADDHRQAAEDIEAVLPDLAASPAGPRANRMTIEAYFGAAFHWIAYGCQTKHGKHKENHTKLVSYLRDIGEPEIGERWRVLEEIRNGGWYGHHHEAADAAQAEALWQGVRQWALS
jgi:hypothetical protein